MVNRWIETPIEQLAESIDLQSHDPESLVVVGSLLAEVLDSIPGFPAINTELLFAEAPSLFVFINMGNETTADCYGFMDMNGSLVVAPEENPVASVIVAWAKRLPSQDLFIALTSPEDLPGGSKMKEWLV